MERKRFCVTFFLRRARTNKAGLAPILARITTNGVSKEVYIQCSVPVDRWNQSKRFNEGTLRKFEKEHGANVQASEYSHFSKSLVVPAVRQQTIEFPQARIPEHDFGVPEWGTTGPVSIGQVMKPLQRSARTCVRHLIVRIFE